MAQELPVHRAREYETIFIVHPDAGTEVMDRVAGRCREVVGRLNGRLLKAENWGRRRLAYPVKKSDKGYFVYLRYLGYSNLVQELERNLRMLDPVLKYMTVKIDEDVDPEARPAREEDISFVPRTDEDDRAAAPEVMEDKPDESAEQVAQPAAEPAAEPAAQQAAEPAAEPAAEEDTKPEGDESDDTTESDGDEA